MSQRAVTPRTLADLAAHAGAELRGDGNLLISGVAPLDAAGEGDLAFLAGRGYRHQLATTGASAVILRADDLPECPAAALVCSDPYAVYALAAQLLYPQAAAKSGIHRSAVVGEGVTFGDGVEVGPQVVIGDHCVLGQGVRIGPGCVLDAGVTVGDGSWLVARVTLGHDVWIGARALIHPGAVIGADGFGFARAEGRWLKIPQVGSVRIGDDVEIGANTTIDRGAVADTVISDGVKLDNLIMIGHNVRIGADTAMAASCGVAGSTVIGARCTIGGNVGITGHIEITDDVHISGRSFVTGSIREPGAYSSGMPLQETRKWRRNMARLKNLDELAQRLIRLEKTQADN